MDNYELHLPLAPRKKRPHKIKWTPEMITRLKTEYPTQYNKELAAELGVSWRSLVRKARELGVEKEPGFLEKRRTEIQKMAVEAKAPQPTKGKKGWCVPNSEATRFQPGNISPMKTDPEVVKKVRSKRNETIRRERIRLKIGLKPLTKLKLKV